MHAAHAWGYRPPEGQGESRIHLSRVKRLTVVGLCLALALTGCSFQGLNSLPLPGAVGRGPDAVTYHVEVPNVATLESRIDGGSCACGACVSAIARSCRDT